MSVRAKREEAEKKSWINQFDVLGDVDSEKDQNCQFGEIDKMETHQRKDLADSKKGIKENTTSKKLAKLNKLDAFNGKSAKREPHTWGDEPEDNTPRIPATKGRQMVNDGWDAPQTSDNGWD